MKIEMLYPEICCLYGDKANVRYLKDCVLNSEVIETGLNEKPHFLDEKISLVYMGSTSEEGQKKIIQKLMPYKEEIKKCVEEGMFFLFTGNAFEVFFEEIEIEKEKIEGLNIFPFKAICDLNKRHNSLYLGKFQEKKVVGYTSRFSHTYGDNPYFTKYLLKEMGMEDSIAFEDDVIEAYLDRVQEFEKDICFED